ncbi:MAG: GNAT family N-acetyltransferase [Acidobacteria bacterium]|nr:MAG: GNAT family N-acetyltransferase [Acidobacteriota bacterium]REJ99131.1 MAG: GNAT family N-acetyltransferase [Acidobacteriota bacterium]REK16148.1 MAG: GNAT family N-acetyltransferase [Acidobacteriota bacterium]REK43829.1 MAG: GNAT family N-acetyltransferase [Acidobacteriota bacterium]
MTVELREVNEKNFDECIGLKVAESQNGFVATNLMSIAHSAIYPGLKPRAVYDGDEMVGFVLFGLDPDEGKHFLVRLMVDESRQGKGYGRLATEKVIEELRNTEGCDAIYLYCVPDNENAFRLYESLGFERTGKIDEEDGEVEMRLGL